MHLVLLALEAAEEPLDAFVLAAPLHDELRLVVGQIAPRHVEPRTARACAARFSCTRQLR